MLFKKCVLFNPNCMQQLCVTGGGRGVASKCGRATFAALKLKLGSFKCPPPLRGDVCVSYCFLIGRWLVVCAAMSIFPTPLEGVNRGILIGGRLSGRGVACSTPVPPKQTDPCHPRMDGSVLL